MIYYLDESSVADIDHHLDLNLYPPYTHSDPEGLPQRVFLHASARPEDAAATGADCSGAARVLGCKPRTALA